MRGGRWRRSRKSAGFVREHFEVDAGRGPSRLRVNKPLPLQTREEGATGRAGVFAGLEYNPGHYGETQCEKADQQACVAEAGFSSRRKAAQGRGYAGGDPASAAGAGAAAGGGVAGACGADSAGRGLLDLRFAPRGGRPRHVFTSRGLAEPRTSPQSYADATFYSMECSEGCFAGVARGDFLETGGLKTGCGSGCGAAFISHRKFPNQARWMNTVFGRRRSPKWRQLSGGAR